jgi:ATP adenylyltransferase
MNYLWAPWRMDYILKKKKKGCIFCKKPNGKKTSENLILYQGKKVFVIMNKFPYNTGHIMVVPNRHCSDLDQLDEEEYQEFFGLVRTGLCILKKSLRPQGFNVGINLGKAGGAGVDEHIHLHIVPRWNGDSNFMPVISDTRIIPEHLKKTYEKLHASFVGIFGKEKRKGGAKR